jgi:molybdate transport system ATP-binding protein
LNTSACRLARAGLSSAATAAESALARALSGELTLLSGQRECTFSRITRLSFEQLQKLVSDEWQRNNTDLLSPGEEDTGRTTAEIIQDEFKDPPAAPPC